MLSSVIETYSELLKLKGWYIANSNEDTNLFARNHVNHGVVYVLEYGDCLKKDAKSVRENKKPRCTS